MANEAPMEIYVFFNVKQNQMFRESESECWRERESCPQKISDCLWILSESEHQIGHLSKLWPKQTV